MKKGVIRRIFKDKKHNFRAVIRFEGSKLTTRILLNPPRNFSKGDIVNFEKDPYSRRTIIHKI